MLLLFSGDSAISSDAAATTIQKAGWDRKSTTKCGKRHIQSSRYFTSSLLTRFSTWLRRVNISRLVSFISVCNVSRLVAICSTALVSLITAAAASSLRRENPNSPIAATLMDAPAIAANTSITAQAGVASSLAQSPNPAEVLPLLKDTTPSSVTGPGTGFQLL